MTGAATIDEQLADAVAEYYADPLGFVKFAYPWGEPGALELYDGPDAWQSEFLRQLGEEVRRRGFDGIRAVDPIRMARTSGHGIGKSTMAAWLTNWIMSTRPHSVGTVTANTITQLSTKTWAAVETWTKRCITAHWWVINTERIYHRDFRESWFCTPQTCRRENSEAFAGQHAATSTSWYLLDEASAIPDEIFEVAEGGLTDGEPMIFLFGNPTRNTGKLYRVVFGSDQKRWNYGTIDSRNSKISNKQTIADWLKDYGEDSDFFRVRVRGLAPRASELQFIDGQRIWDAQQRKTEALADDPLIAGVDVSGGGSAWTVCRFRKGVDGKCIPPIRLTGEQSRDRSVVIARLAEVLRDKRPERKVAAMFIDSAFGSPIVERLHVLGFDQVHEVSFGSASPDGHQANKRAYMWNRMKDWLLRGMIDPNDTKLAMDMAGPGYHINRQNKLVLESKADMQKRGEASPDDGDALALTFAQDVAPQLPGRPREPQAEYSQWG
jgi:hypothetical protein